MQPLVATGNYNSYSEGLRGRCMLSNHAEVLCFQSCYGVWGICAVYCVYRLLRVSDMNSSQINEGNRKREKEMEQNGDTEQTG